MVAQPAAQTAAHATQFRQIFKPPTTGQPSAWLRAQGAATRFPIDSAEIWIGAAEGNRIRVAEDLAVSWNHACVQWAAGDLYLFDNRSTNGTSVNGHRMEAGSRVRLQAGDRIEMGRAVFLLET